MDKRKDGQVVQLFWAIGQFCKGNLVDQMESAAAELTSALSTIQSPISTNAQRQRAHETIEAAKQRPSECATLGVALILRTESCLEAGNSKFLALSLLQHVLRFHWDTISKQEKETLKDAMVAWVAGPESSLNHAPRFLVEKSCAVLAQIAERMWPVNWRQFDDFLKTLFYKDIHSQERALLVFKCLVEDTFLFENSIAELRKKDLSISLIAITVDAPVLNKVYCSGDRALASSVSSGLNVDYVLNMIRADPGNEGWLLRLSKNLIRLKQSDQNANPNIKHLIRLSLETIAAILNWIILEGIESSNILALLFELLISPSFEERMDATECLITLLSRSSLVSEEHCWRVILDPIFDSPFLLAGIRTAVAGVYGLGPDAWGVTLDQATQRIAVIETERHEYLKKLAELIAVFGEHQVFYKHMTQKPPNFGSFLELVVYFTCHPSRSISLAVAPIWSDMATHEVYKHAPELSNYKVRLIDCSVARITQMHSLPPGPGGPFSPETVRAYDEVEFLEEGEKAACIDALRQRCMELVKFLMVDYAAVVVATVEGYTRALAFTPQEDARNEFGFYASKSRTASQLEGGAMLVEHVMRNVAREKVDPMDTHFDVVLVQRLSTYFTEILNFETPDPIVLRFLMSALVCIAEVSRDDTLLLRCIEKIVNCVTFTLPDEVNFLQRNAFMREETRQLRMKAASALVKLAVALPDVLINLFDRFVIIIQSFVHDGKVIPFERVKLIEFLLALIHHSSKSMPEKQIMFGRILGSYVHEWEALDESAFSSVGALIEALGVSRIAVNGQLAPAELTAIETWRQKVNVSVRAWMMWMKRTDTKPSLWPQYVYRILPKILVIVRAIHELSDPTVWVNIPANLHINTSISEGMKEAILKKSNITAAKGASNDFKGFMTTIESWVAGIREACYTIIGTLTSIGPTIYAIPNISSILLGCIFGRGAAHLSTRHWKSLVSSIVRPLLVHCPPDARANIFNVIFPHFSRFLDEKLKTEWNTLELAKQGAVVIDESGEDDEVNEEVVAEKLLRDLTRTYADLLTAIASPNEGKPVSKREEETMSDERSLNCYVISDQAVFSSVFQCLLTVMLLKDTVASRKSILCIVKSVPLLVKMMRADVMQFLGDIVMRACLEVFHDGYFQEVHNEAIVLMSDIYAFLREHNSPVAYQTLLSLPGMSSDSVQAFDNAFMLPHKTKREKHVIIKDFLKNIRGASVSEAFKQFDGKAKARPLFIRNTKSRDVLNDPDDPAAIVLGDFF